MVERENEEVPLRTQARLLTLNQSSLYYQASEPSDEEVRLKHRIDEIYTKFPVYGSRRITQELRSEGWNINRKHVQRCMREMDIAGIFCPGPNLSKRNLQHKRNFTPSHPNHVFGIDITYSTSQTWMYFVVVIDCHFTSEQYTDLLKEAGIRISMGGKNRALYNIITERFWRTLKYEEVYLNEYNNPKEAR